MSLVTDILIWLGLLKPAPGLALPRVLIKIADSISLDLDIGDTLSIDQLVAKAGALGIGTTDETIQAIGSKVVFKRAFDSVSAKDIQALLATAEAEDPTYEPFNFGNALEVVCDPGFDTSDLETALNKWTGVVEFAYRCADASDPTVAGAANPLFSFQKYLDGAPDGIGVESAWARGGDGSGTTMIDLEQGWFLRHHDLPTGIPLLGGTNKKESFAHGAGVLGIVVASDNAWGIVGIAPKAEAKVISYFDAKGTNGLVQRVEDRILAAGVALRKGDVLLLEVQFELKTTPSLARVPGAVNALLPVEIDPLVWNAIRLVTATGATVVEVAGNGASFLDPATHTLQLPGLDLDIVLDRNGKKVLSRSTPTEFRDSGAIMVTGCTPKTPHVRFQTTDISLNFGSRIDCYAWGDQIVTCFSRPVSDPKLLPPTDLFWGIGTESGNYFGGTSGAAPIIAGCCLLIQHLQTLLKPKGRPSGKIGSKDMRAILTNPLNGTASANPTDNIGVMPDFAKIVANEFLP